MTLDDLKAEAAKLSPRDLNKLTGFLHSLAVAHDPEWKRIVAESAEMRKEAERQRVRASRRQKAKPTAA